MALSYWECQGPVGASFRCGGRSCLWNGSRMREQGNMGRLRFVAVVVGAMLIVGVPSATPAPPRDAGVRLTILGASQRTLLKARAVRVRVAARRAVTVRVAAAGSSARTVRFRHRGTRILSLPL